MATQAVIKRMQASSFKKNDQPMVALLRIFNNRSRHGLFYQEIERRRLLLKDLASNTKRNTHKDGLGFG